VPAGVHGGLASFWESRYWLVAGLSTACVAALAVTASWQLAALLGGVMVFAFALALVRDFVLHAATFLAFSTLPAALPLSVSAGGVPVVFHEVLLFVALLMALPRIRWSSASGLIALALTSWGLLGVLWGEAHGYAFRSILFDSRSSLVLAAAFMVVTAARPETLRRLWARTIPVTLLVSAVTMALGSIGLIATSAHTFSARLDYQEPGGSASRQLGSTGFVAVAALMCVVVLFLLRKPIPGALRFMVPLAIAIVALSFSRSHLVGLAVTVLYGLFEARRYRSLAAVVPRVAVVGLAAIPVTFLVLAIGSTLAPNSWIRSVATSYALRVFEGLGSQARNQDMSLQYRVDEYAGLTRSIDQAPFIGHGFGHAYRAPVGAAGQYFHDAAPYYSHNFYLWATDKVGALGLGVILLLFLWPILRPASDDVVNVCARTAMVSFLAISLAVPLPNGQTSGLLVGGVLAIAMRNRGAARPAVDAQPPRATATVVRR
jgi:O-antigen ligase